MLLQMVGLQVRARETKKRSNACLNRASNRSALYYIATLSRNVIQLLDSKHLDSNKCSRDLEVISVRVLPLLLEGCDGFEFSV